MSRSNQSEQIKNPATLFFEWNGIKGGFSYYDKEKKEDVPVPYPFTFMVLDVLYTVKGYHKPSKTGYYSNEIRIRNYDTDKFVIKSKNGIEFSGKWAQIGDAAAKVGCKLYHSVYIAYKTDSGLVLANMKLKGGAKTALNAFRKNNDIFKIAMVVKSHEMIEGVSSPYAVPVFSAIPDKNISKESQDAATHLDKQLQEYLKVYFEINSSLNEQTLEQTVESANKPQEQPKEQPKAAVTSEPTYTYDPSADNEEMPF